VRKFILVLIAAVIIIGLFVGGRYLTYYGGDNYTPPPSPQLEVNISEAEQPPTGLLEVEPIRGRGTLLIDQAHDNNFASDELNVLLERLSARGYDHEFLTDTDELADRLKYADAMLVVAPDASFEPEEVAPVRNFVDKGGRLLFISDPTRNDVEHINSLAGHFGVLFEGDYVYNLVENDDNYRNVIMRDFAENDLTRGLDGVAFYSACSLATSGEGLISGDENTVSNLESVGNHPEVASLTSGGQVLALCDLTFLTEPYNAVLNNDQLVANVARFLTSGQRTLDLSDFPHFFSPSLDIVFGDSFLLSGHVEQAVVLKDALFATGRKAAIRDEEDPDTDLIFVGRFKDAEKVDHYLKQGGISILDVEDENGPADTQVGTASTTEPGSDLLEEEDGFVRGSIAIEGVGQFEQGGTSLFYLLQEPGHNVLVVLTDRHETAEDAFELLDSGEFAECLAGPNLAVCQTQEPGERLGPSQRAEKIESILIVSDDDSSPTSDGITAFDAYLAILEESYLVSTWVASEQGEVKLTLDDLQAVDAVIWTTGDFWDDAPDEEDAELLEEFIKKGGNLLISGGFIAFDWDHTSFIEEVLHADYLGLEDQRDIKLAAPEHPIARGFEEDQTIAFVVPPSEETYAPNAIAPLEDAETIFVRGPDSEAQDEASVLAFQNRRSRVAYIGFPMFLMQGEEQIRLVNNVVRWFGLPEPEPTEKATEEPAEEETPPEEEVN
jgi:hypothetical protein